MKPIEMTHEGKPLLILAWPDWMAVGGYLVELERQLKASCLALGGSAVQCQTTDLQ